MTNYIVFSKKTENEWAQFTAQEARSARAAIRQALEGDDNPYGAGTYVAVPVRSWKPVKVSVELKTEIKYDQ